ncbi:MAG: TolC family protein [Bacteroidia bacterium]
MLPIKTSFFLLFVGNILLSVAQTSTYSLQKAQATAKANKVQLQSDKLSTEIAQAQVKAQVFRRYPQINTSADVKANLILPTTVIPAGVFGADKRTVQFGQIFNQTLGVEVNQIIYDKKLRYDTEQANLNLKLTEITRESNEEEIRAAVTKAYLNVLVNEEREKQLEASKARLLKDKEEIVKKVEAGALVELERKRIETSIATTELQIEQQKDAVRLAYQLLKFNMGLPNETEISLADNWQTLNDWVNTTDTKYGKFSPEIMPLHRLQRIQITLNENQYNRQKALLYPTLSAYGYIGVQGFSNHLRYFGNDPIPWFGLSYLGLRLNWNVNTLWENGLYLPQQELRIRQARSVLAEQEEALNLAVTQAENTTQRAAKDILIQAENIKFAQENLAYLKTRFEAEVVTAREVIDAEADLVNYQANELIARYNYLVALFDLRKAKGEH